MTSLYRDHLGRLLAWLTREEMESAANGGLAEIVGTRHDDFLVGTPGADRIDGRKGADTMVGGQGDDVYLVDNIGDQIVEVEGEGTDTVKSRVSYTLAFAIENLTLDGRANIDGAGNALANQLSGNSGDNRLDGAGGNDVISAHKGDDTLIGGAGDDSLDGGQGNDSLDGGAGVDLLIGGLGDDTYTLTADVDQIQEQADQGHDTVRATISASLAANLEDLVLTGSADLEGIGNELANRISGNKGSNLLSGAAGADELIGHQGDDTLLGGEGDDRLDGSAGDDSVDGGAGADLLIGGAGHDSYVVDNLADVVVEGGAGGTDLVKSTVTYTLGDHVENLTLTIVGGPVNTDGFGNSLANVIIDSYGLNLIDGGDGDDTIIGGHHVTVWTGDTLIGGAGNDSIQGGDYTGNDLLYGGTGNDTLSAEGGGALYGEDGDDVLTGGPGFGHHGGGNSLYGGLGNDTLESGMAQYGDGGNDLLQTVFNSTADGGEGNDTIRGSGGGGYWDFRVDGGSGDDSIDVSSNIARLVVKGGDGADTIEATTVRSLSVDAGAGNDVVVAVAGGEGLTVFGGDGDDQLSLGSVQHTSGLLDGGSGDDILQASTPEVGGGITLSGGIGNDTLYGLGGPHQLVGGEGFDTFVLAPSIEWYFSDTIADFSTSEDAIAVSQAQTPIGNGDLVVDNATTTNGPGGFSPDAEVVLLAQDLVGDLTMDAIAQAFGAADEAYTQGQSAVFIASNGTDTWVLRFESSGDDAVISANELMVMGAVSGTKPLLEDIVFSG